MDKDGCRKRREGSLEPLNSCVINLSPLDWNVGVCPGEASGGFTFLLGGEGLIRLAL